MPWSPPAVPPHPSMPADVHHCWRRVYDFCAKHFTSIDGYGLADARLSANAVVAGYYTPSGRRRAPRRARKLPKLGGLIELGVFRKLWCATADGDVIIQRETTYKLPLLWSQRRRACILLPGATVGAELRPTSKEDRLMRLWQRGRGAKRAYELRGVPEPMMRPPLVTVAIEYFSDKFSRGRGIFYVHHHEPNVLTSVSNTRDPNGDPVAVWVRGGKLRITPDGLEG